MTERQLSAMVLYFVAGLSFRAAGEVLGMTSASVQRLVARGRATAIRDCAEAGSHEEAEAMLHAMLAQPERHAAVARQDTLMDAIEARIRQRDTDLAEVEDCMRGEILQVSHHALNTWDQWELTLINKHGWASMQSTWFECKKLGQFAVTPCP